MGIPAKEIKEYHDKFDMIPKDWLERLAYLHKLQPYQPEVVNSLIDKIDELVNARWDEVTYIFYMNPKTSHRPRLNRKTFTFYVKDAKDYKRIFDEFMEAHSGMEVVVSTPCQIITKAYFETPKSMSMEEKLAAELELIHHVNNPDYDNVAKRYTDMIQKTLVSNDSIIFRGETEKFYSILPRIEITLKYMTRYDCKYNRRVIQSRKSFKENDLTIKDIDSIL